MLTVHLLPVETYRSQGLQGRSPFRFQGLSRRSAAVCLLRWRWIATRALGGGM